LNVDRAIHCFINIKNPIKQLSIPNSPIILRNVKVVEFSGEYGGKLLVKTGR